MNATASDRLTLPEMGQLKALESESIYIIREGIAEFERPCLLFSGGKDSIVMLHLAMQAVAPAHQPIPVAHIDPGHNSPEVIESRDTAVTRPGAAPFAGAAHDVRASGRRSTTERRTGPGAQTGRAGQRTSPRTHRPPRVT